MCSADQEAEDRPDDADRLGVRPVGALAGLLDRGQHRLAALDQLRLALALDAAVELGDLSLADPLLVRGRDRLARLVLAGLHQHQGFPALLDPQPLLGPGGAEAGLVAVPFPLPRSRA